MLYHLSIFTPVEALMKIVSLLLMFVSLNAFGSQNTELLEAAEKEAVAFYKLESTQKAFAYTAVSDDMIDSGCMFRTENSEVILCTVTDSLPVDSWSEGVAVEYSARHGVDNLFMFSIKRIEH